MKPKYFGRKLRGKTKEIFKVYNLFLSLVFSGTFIFSFK